MEKKYLTIPEAARRLGVHRQAVYNMVKQGRLPAVRIGRNYAIAEEDLKGVRVRKRASPRSARIKRGVKRVVAEYGEALKMLGED